MFINFEISLSGKGILVLVIDSFVFVVNLLTKISVLIIELMKWKKSGFIIN